MGLNLKILKISLELFTWRYIQKALRTRLIMTPMLLFVKTLRTVIRCDDVITFESLQPTPFCLERASVRKGIFFMFEQHFQCEYGWNKVQYARITISHVCFTVLTLAGSFRRCSALCPLASCSISLLGTPQMLMHEKTCVIPIVDYRSINLTQ